MNVLITAGPTREPIDSVRFITNASSGRMGCACAAAAVQAGHDVTLLLGPCQAHAPDGAEVVPFATVSDLKSAVEERFADAGALIMSAAVGDFTVAEVADAKLPRRGGPVSLTLIPTEDILAAVAAGKRPDQIVIGFAVEDSRNEAKARRELATKHCDYIVLNTPAAMGDAESEACILSADSTVLDWADRPKQALAREIIALLTP